MYPEGKLLFFKQKQLKKVISFISNHHRYYYYIYIFDDEGAKLLSRDWGGGGGSNHPGGVIAAGCWGIPVVSWILSILYLYTFPIKISFKTKDNMTPPEGNSVNFVSRESQCFLQQTLMINK